MVECLLRFGLIDLLHELLVGSRLRFLHETVRFKLTTDNRILLLYLYIYMIVRNKLTNNNKTKHTDGGSISDKFM